MSIPKSQIEVGFYYEHKRVRGWLRLVLYIRGDAATYAESTGEGHIGRHLTLQRWASRRLSAEEAAKEFPDEVAKIAAVLAKARVFEYLP